MLTREQFVKICNDKIKQTKENIAICNQKSGYLKYHNEIKHKNYFDNVRVFQSIVEKQLNCGYLLPEWHALTKQCGMGNCNELADYLAGEIITALQEEKIDARIRIVSSSEEDHVFVHIKILLKDERMVSLWEIDAWDPRIIDITMRPDGSIKNSEVLRYGIFPNILHVTTTMEFKQSAWEVIPRIRKPIAGRPAPERSPTPEREIEKMYKDYTLEAAVDQGKMMDIDDDELGYLQKVSLWQKKST